MTINRRTALTLVAAATAIATLTGPTPAADASGVAFASNNEYKRVAITVSWTDANGSTQSIGLEDAIGAVSPGDGSKVVLNNTATSEPRYPRVLINDPSLTEGVIPIAVGDGTETAATNPKPEIVGNKNSQQVVETRFDVLTYGSRPEASRAFELRLLREVFQPRGSFEGESVPVTLTFEKAGTVEIMLSVGSPAARDAGMDHSQHGG